jgi:hypothetical protein
MEAQVTKRNPSMGNYELVKNVGIKEVEKERRKGIWVVKTESHLPQS